MQIQENDMQNPEKKGTTPSLPAGKALVTAFDTGINGISLVCGEDCLDKDSEGGARTFTSEIGSQPGF